MDVDALIEARVVHEIHTSERRSFRACRRRWDWAFNKAWYPKITAKPLEFGVAYHEAMEVYYEPEMWETDRQVRAALAIQTFVAKCEEQRQNALENGGSSFFYDEDVEIDYNERVELGKGMLNYYFTEVAPVVDVGWKPVKVEIGFMVPIPNVRTGEEYIICRCVNCKLKWDIYISDEDIDDVKFRGLPVVYAGRLDMLAEDLTNKGTYYIFDWKTARTIPNNHDFLYLDDQIGSYVWALSRIGLNVRGFVYHEQRKGFPQAPKRNKQRRLGLLYSIAKNQDTDYDSYLETVRAHDAEAYEAGLYDEYLTYLKQHGIKFFERSKIAKVRQELDEIQRNISLEALDMINTDLSIYPSPGRFGCQFCAFQTPCIEMNSGGDYEVALQSMYEQREHYYIRKDASTESKSGE